MSLLRVGDVVYQDRKVCAVRVHGAWYRQHTSGEAVELVPIDQAEATSFDHLVDVTKIKMTGGEEAILATARHFVGNPRMGGDNLERLHTFIEAGVRGGLRKYGPFRPDKESRDLEAQVLRCIRNAIVFATMAALRDGRDNTGMRELVATLGRLWIDAMWARDRRRQPQEG